MTVARVPRSCAHCGEVRVIRARGLCSACYQRAKRAGTATLHAHPVRSSTRVVPVVECLRCGRERPHRARSLCDACYVSLRRDGGLHAYPPIQGKPAPDMSVDDVAVDRAVAWLLGLAATRRDERRRIQGPTRPTLTRGEKIAVLRRTRHDVPRAVALEALGVSGRLYRSLAREAGLIR